MAMNDTSSIEEKSSSLVRDEPSQEIIEIEKKKLENQERWIRLGEKLVEEGSEKLLKPITDIRARESRHLFWLYVAAFLVIGGVLLGIGILRFFDKLSGEAFAFLTGTIVGAVLTILGSRFKGA